MTSAISYTAPQITSVQPTTISGETATTITIFGSYFGPSSDTVTGQISGTYGTCGFTYSQHSDGVGSASAVGTVCTNIVGTGYSVSITVGGQSTTLSNAISVAAPVINSASMGGSQSTAGGQPLTITGTNFGTDSDIAAGFVTVHYGTYQATSCSHADANTIVCTTVAGVGSNLQVYIVAGGQTSTLSGAISVSYAAPSISNVSPGELETDGTTTVTISGSNFGTSSDSPTYAYGPSADTDLYTGSCTVQTSHTTLTCTTAAGIGTTLVFAVTVGGQTGSFNTEFHYKQPAITSFTPAGPFQTSATPTLTIVGTNFGPTSGNTISADYYQMECSSFGIGSATIFAFEHKPNQLDVDALNANSLSNILSSSDDTGFVGKRLYPGDLLSESIVIPWSDVSSAICLTGRETTKSGSAFVSICLDFDTVRLLSRSSQGEISVLHAQSSIGTASSSEPITLRLVEGSSGVYTASYAKNGVETTLGVISLGDSLPDWVGITFSSTHAQIGLHSIETALCTGLSYNTPSCTFTTAHTEVECTAPVGVGTEFHVALRWGTGSSLGSLQSYGSSQNFSRIEAAISGASYVSGSSFASTGGSQVSLSLSSSLFPFPHRSLLPPPFYCSPTILFLSNTTKKYSF